MAESQLDIRMKELQIPDGKANSCPVNIIIVTGVGEHLSKDNLQR